MCKVNESAAEVRLAMQQLELFVEHVQLSVDQWNQYLMEKGKTQWELDLQEISNRADQLRCSLHELRARLGEQHAQDDPPIVITAFKP